MTDRKYLGWSGTTRRTVKRPFCAACLDGIHNANDHGPLGCMVQMGEYFCGCEHGATIDVCAPLPNESSLSMGAMLQERASRLRGGHRTGEIKKAQAAIRRSA